MDAVNNVLNIEKSDDAFAHGCCVNEYSFGVCLGRAAAAGVSLGFEVFHYCKKKK